MNTNIEIIKNIITTKGEKRYLSFCELWKRAKENVKFSDEDWQLLKDMFSSDKTDTLYIPMQILGTLGANGDARIEAEIETFISLVYHQSIVIAPHAAKYLCLFMKSNPLLETKLLPVILGAEIKAKVKHKGLLVAYIIDGLTQYYLDAKDKKSIYLYVKSQEKSESSKARNFVKDFLKKY